LCFLVYVALNTKTISKRQVEQMWTETNKLFKVLFQQLLKECENNYKVFRKPALTLRFEAWFSSLRIKHAKVNVFKCLLVFIHSIRRL